MSKYFSLLLKNQRTATKLQMVKLFNKTWLTERFVPNYTRKRLSQKVNLTIIWNSLKLFFLFILEWNKEVLNKIKSSWIKWKVIKKWGVFE